MTVLSSSYAISSSYSETTDFILGGNVFGPVVDAVNAISSSYAITSSYAETAQTSSYVLNAVSSSYALTASYAVSASHEIIKEISSSYADTASFAQSGNGIFSGSFSGSYIGDGSGLTNIPTPNAVVTASNATNDDTIEFLKGGGGTFSVTVNNIETSQTASYVLNAVSSSYASTASFVETAQTSSYVLNAVSSSYATTSSYVNPLNQTLQLTGSLDVLGSISSTLDIYTNQNLDGGGLNLNGAARISTDGGNLLFLNDLNTTNVNINGGLITGSNILATDIKTTSASGSFSGSFQGDGSGLTGVTAAPANLYTTDGTVGTNRIATIGSSLTWTGGQEIRISNSRIVREVTQDSDLPTALVANTTYIIRGSISTSTNRTCNVEGVEILGQNRDLDEIVWTGTGAFLTLTDCSFNLQGTKFSSTTSGNSILSATNVAASGYNNSRLGVLTILNCQFRGTYDVMDINGYDLVDINNTLFFYIKATNFGLRFRDTSKLEISSCELIRWFDESTIPTPSGYSTVSMIQLQNNNLASFGAVNINGCIVHPQQTQNGIDIGTSSTTGFGTISSNAFINVDLTTGKVFLPEASSLPDYSQTATLDYDIFANQGLLNSLSGCVMTMVGNTTNTALTTGVPAIVNTNSLATNQASVRYTVGTSGRCTYNGIKQTYVSLHTSLTYEKQGGGSDSYIFYFYKNGTVLPGSQTLIDSNGGSGAIGMIYGTLMNTNDYIEIYVENPNSGDDMLISDWQVVIRE
jgi:hypothetical protein